MTALSPNEYEVVFLSIQVATWSVVISMPLSLITAWLLARRQFHGHLILDGLVPIGPHFWTLFEPKLGKVCSGMPLGRFLGRS